MNLIRSITESLPAEIQPKLPAKEQRSLSIFQIPKIRSFQKRQQLVSLITREPAHASGESWCGKNGIFSIFAPQAPAQRGLIAFLALVLAIFLAIHLHLDTRYDFGIFYYAAHMVLDGSRHALYDVSAQHAFQIQYHRPPDTLFRNPPFALIPILPLAKLPMAVAYSVWTAASFALLFVSLKVLQDETGLFYGNWPVLLSLIFAPIMGNFLHGQLSFVVVASYSVAYALWRRGRLTLGGAVLAIATIKFQLVIGFVAVLLLKRRWRELAGFAAGSTVFLALSIWIAGIPSLMAYPHFLLHSDTPLSELPHMANWQGFLTILGLNYWALLVPLSVVTVLWAAWAWKDLDRGFAAATLAAMLVSFHLTPQDISLALVPFYLCVKAGILPRHRVPAFVIPVIATTMAMVIVQVPLAFLAIPLATAFCWIGTEPLEKSSGAENTPSYALSSPELRPNA